MVGHVFSLTSSLGTCHSLEASAGRATLVPAPSFRKRHDDVTTVLVDLVTTKAVTRVLRKIVVPGVSRHQRVKYVGCNFWVVILKMLFFNLHLENW